MDYATLGKEPVPGDKPTGRDCRYDPEFEKLQSEIDKLSSPTASGKVDWDLVVKTAADILQNQSKDLTVASYLAVGLLHTHKIDGLDHGLQVFSDLVQNHWDGLYPPKKRMRGRQGALTWWLEKTDEVLQQVEVDPLPAGKIERITANLKVLDEQLVDKMPDPPLLRPVQRQIERLPVQKEKAPPAAAEPAPASTEVAPDEKPQAAAKPPVAAPAAAPAPAPKSIQSDQDARKSIDSALMQLRQAGHFMLQKELKDATAYRYRRLALWVKLEAVPSNTDGVTQIPPPTPQMVSDLQTYRDEANWPGVILYAEQKLAQCALWIDLNYLTAEGLKILGPDYQKALAAVCQETGCLLYRFPELADLAFSDGTPLAGPDTRKWLQQISPGPGSSAGGGSGEGIGDNDQYNAVVQEAMAMARKKRVVEAAALLQGHMLQAQAGSQKMRWRQAIAQVLLAVKKPQLALPHIDQIVADIDLFKLEAWDPLLAVEGLTTAYKGYSAIAMDTYKLRAQEILGRIAKIDPTEALRL